MSEEQSAASPSPDRYVVVGNPIAHSRSPEIHRAFASQLGEDISYSKVLVEADGFAAFADEFAASGGRGMNVTVPFKADAFAYAADCDPLATAAGAVNTLVFNAGEPCRGFNTDGIGLINDLTRRHRVALHNRSVLMLGAGGAASGVVQPLLAQSPNRLVIANRTLARAQALVAHHRSFREAAATGTPATLEACGFDELSGAFDVVINATSSGLVGDTVPLDPQHIHHAFCYDMSYGQAAVFAAWAAENGAAASVDGLGMLVEQAAQSYYLWRGRRPLTDPVVEQIRASL